ncbi:MAG: hypothetical protein Q9168_005021 [Polycauliona sp. 1 TL-2023]
MEHVDLPDSVQGNLALIKVNGYSEDNSTPSSTHPDRFDHDHITSLEVFSQDLQKAVANSFPRPSTSYTSVHVLLLRWVKDDLNVQDELTSLGRVFEDQYHFATEQWNIPSLNSTRALQTKLYDFQNCHQSEDELLIVYYGGHADADRRRGRSIWAANVSPDSPTLAWSSLQHLLENAVPHVLIILDCCYAANAARDTSEGTTKELIAACGRENPTLGVGARSFTSALIEELQAFGAQPFTAAMLHSRLITMRWRLAFTPVYALLSEHGGHSIELAPQPPPAHSTNQISGHEPNHDEDMMDISAPEAMAQGTRVLLAVSISDDAVCDIVEWKQWLVNRAPRIITQIEVKVEGVFKSHSTMLIASLPVVAWDRLPDKAAYRFIGFIKSGNLNQAQSHSEKESERLALTVGIQQRELQAFKKRVQVHERDTMSTKEDIAKEREKARDQRQEMQKLVEDTKSYCYAQQELVTQKHAQLYQTQEEMQDETKSTLVILDETRLIIDHVMNDVHAQMKLYHERRKEDSKDKESMDSRLRLVEKLVKTIPEGLNPSPKPFPHSSKLSKLPTAPFAPKSLSDSKISPPKPKAFDFLGPQFGPKSTSSVNKAKVSAPESIDHILSSSKDGVKLNTEEARLLTLHAAGKDGGQTVVEDPTSDSDTTTSPWSITFRDHEDYASGGDHHNDKKIKIEDTTPVALREKYALWTPSVFPILVLISISSQTSRKRGLTASKQATHECDICGKTFRASRASYNLRNHMKKTHDDATFVPSKSSEKSGEGHSPRITRSSQRPLQTQPPLEVHEVDDKKYEILRCVCGHQDYPGLPVGWQDPTNTSSKRNSDANDVTLRKNPGDFTIQCDDCKVWQHGGCVGITAETMSPEKYFCEQCRDDLHTVTTTVEGQAQVHLLLHVFC